MLDEKTLGAQVLRVLASAVLIPELRSILLVNASYGQLMYAAHVLGQLITSVDSEGIEISSLSTTETDEVIWGVPFLWYEGGRARPIGKARISNDQQVARDQLIVIANLAQLSLAAERAFVTTAGADVVHLERYGQTERWCPQVYWLAACAEQDIGKVSLHLLDRIAVRMHVQTSAGITEGEKVQRMLRAMGAQPLCWDIDMVIPENFLGKLRRASKVNPRFSPEAAERVLEVLPYSVRHTARRDLALGRLASAQSMLDGAELVLPQHVEMAAASIGLTERASSVTSELEPLHNTLEEEVHDVKTDINDEPTESLAFSLPVVAKQIAVVQDAPIRSRIVPQETVLFEPDADSGSPQMVGMWKLGSPYIEDDAHIEREAELLRMPVRRDGSRQKPRGRSVGIEKASDLHDLALAATIFEAAKYWPLRRTLLHRKNQRLEIHPWDLRQYRRLPVPETLLVLVIDYTSLRKSDWQSALLPHLEWAYVSRSSVALIRVGARDAVDEVRAERILGRSLLSPQIDAMLEAQPGKATPLAHGLDLALQTLQSAMQHGRNVVSQAKLVVITDGRGNVPLIASQVGEIKLPVRREGFDDAVEVAKALDLLNRVEIVFLSPLLSQHAELSEILANTMGVEPILIPRQSEFAPLSPQSLLVAES